MSSAGFLASAPNRRSALAEATNAFDIEKFIERQFIAYDSDYLQRKASFRTRLDELSQELIRAERSGNKLPCSNQIYLEAKWLQRYTAHWERLEKTLQRLQLSLHDADQSFAPRQSPQDGWWGACFTEEFLKVEANVDGLSDLIDTDKSPRYPVNEHFGFSSYQGLLTYLEGLLVSNIAKTGVDNLGELASITATISRGLFKHYLQTDLIDHTHGEFADDHFRRVTDAYEYFLQGSQNLETGYWGAWYDNNGRSARPTTSVSRSTS